MSDTIIRVRRDGPLVLPQSYVRQETRYQGQHHVGPEAYDVNDLELWRHPAQSQGFKVIGHLVFDTLAKYDLISRCLNLHDLEAILEKGATFYHAHFQGKPVYGWQTRAMDKRLFSLIPALVGDRRDRGKLSIGWVRLNQYVAAAHPTWLLPAKKAL